MQCAFFEADPRIAPLHEAAAPDYASEDGDIPLHDYDADGESFG